MSNTKFIRVTTSQILAAAFFVAASSSFLVAGVSDPPRLDQLRRVFAVVCFLLTGRGAL